MKIVTLGPYFSGKLGNLLGKGGSPASSAAQLSHECSVNKSQSMYIEPVLLKWKNVSSYNYLSRQVQTGEHFKTRTVEIHSFLVAVVLLMAMLYQVGPGNCIVL